MTRGVSVSPGGFSEPGNSAQAARAEIIRKQAPTDDDRGGWVSVWEEGGGEPSISGQPRASIKNRPGERTDALQKLMRSP